MLKLAYRRCRDNMAYLTLLSGPDCEVAHLAAQRYTCGWHVDEAGEFTVSSSAGALRLPTWAGKGWRSTEKDAWACNTQCYKRSLDALAKLVAACNNRKNVCSTEADEGVIC